MRRKSERVVHKKAKASPEKTIEKPRRPRTRRKKQTSSSDNESVEEPSVVADSGAVLTTETKLPETPKKENVEEAQDQVWQVKTSEGDVGIQKLKLCLTRPPTTPERGDKSPRSKGKHSRTASSSDTPSVDSVDEKRKKHRYRKASHDAKSEKNNDTQVEHAEVISEVPESSVKEDNEVTQSEPEQSTEAPVSTTNEEEPTVAADNTEPAKSDEPNIVNDAEIKPDAEDKCDAVDNTDSESKTDADTTVASPKAESTVVQDEPVQIEPEPAIVEPIPKSNEVEEPSESPSRKRSASVDKSEILELHPEDSKIEMSDLETTKTQEDETKMETETEKDQQPEVSITQEQTISNDTETENNGQIKSNESAVLESENSSKELRKMSIDSENDKDVQKCDKPTEETLSNDVHTNKESKDSESAPTVQENTVVNGQPPATAANRKRRWGSRPSKLTTQKSITISTDVLKDIIPDVKPVEFDEVIEEKKHRREVIEKVEKPILPKIVIDNTDMVDRNRRELEKNAKEKEIFRPKDSLASNRKISIIKDDDSAISRPPSPPKNKQSCILYITNLVRPFTLQQLKNLLQRTGKIAEDGFWIDKIKSKCFVKYVSEEHAVETRHALHGVTWPNPNPKPLQVDFSTEEAFEKAKSNVETENAQVSTIPGTVKDWLREQELKKEKDESNNFWDKKNLAKREWDVGKGETDKERGEKIRRDDRPMDKKRHRSIERSPEPARKFKKKEEEAPAKLLDDLFRKTKTTPCIYWLPLSAETIAVKEEQRRQHMAEYERRMQEQRRPHRRH